MRGIAFIGGAGPEAARCRALVEGADILVAADSGLILAEQAGLRPDWIVGDMDSLDDLRRLEAYPPERILRCPRDKDLTDTELALGLLWEKGCGETWLMGGGGGRLDHLFALRSLFERCPRPQRWVTGTEDIYCLNAQEQLALKLQAGALLSIFPLGSGPWELRSRGLKWPLEGLAWDRGFFGLSNVLLDADCSLCAEAGHFLVILPQETPVP
ncbi:MAG: thiamine diphosphokinase [Treponema sp.]|jgi:thiamine pyrophosphokinase|nr:thiamine diphosphokinase [Treponema sp.]